MFSLRSSAFGFAGRVTVATFLLLGWLAAQPPPQQPLKPSYRPAIGQTFTYRLLVNGDVQAEVGGVTGVAHFAATVDVEQRWRQEGSRLRCDVTVKGGTLRVFSSVGEQQQKLGWVPLTFITTPEGEIVDVIGGGARSLEELVANFDLMATALACLIVPFPEEGMQVGDAWQAAHQLGATITLATIQCVEQPTNLPARLQPFKLRLRYLLPIDALIDPLLRAQWQFTARYSAESEVVFSLAEARTLSATGTIKLEVSGQVPIPSPQSSPSAPSPPEQKSQGTPEGQQSGETQQPQEQPPEQPQEQAQNQPTPSPLVAPTFKLLVNARFDLVPSR